MAQSSDRSAPKGSGPQLVLVAAIGAFVGVGLLVLKNPVVPALLLTDGIVAGLVLCAAGLGGMAVLPVFGLGPLPRYQQLLFGAGLGLGVLSALVLTLGLAGVLNRAVWIALLALLAVAGLMRWRPGRSHDGTPPETPGPWRWLWLVVAPFLVLAILSACVPPGYLWAEEGQGYDVLEYHLQMPAEYLQAGRIAYAPHNVYANFPANVEMLYLLTMILFGGAIEAVIAAKLLNAGLGILAVAAAWMIGRQRGPIAGVVSAVLAASTGWLTYLSGVAYVENEMLLFGLLAAAAVNQAVTDPARRNRWSALAGALAGFSVGCKFPALALIAVPLALGLFVGLTGPLRRRAAPLGLYVIGVLVTFAPWAAKNTALTGNPVFPLANGVFKAYPDGWGERESVHFAASHTPLAAERSLPARFAKLWAYVPADPQQRFGPMLLVLAGWTLCRRRGDPQVRSAAACLAMQVPVWLLATHLYARFAVPFLIPLIGLSGVMPTTSRGRRVLVALLMVGTGWNLAFTARLYAQHMLPGGTALPLEGATGTFTTGSMPGQQYLALVNQDLPPDARILLIGDARPFYIQRPVDYCVVFNRSPLTTALDDGASPAELVAWLGRRGYTHVVVHWGEIQRLRRSAYGFDARINRDLFGKLVEAGLGRTHAFGRTAAGLAWVEIYQVPRTDPQ